MFETISARTRVAAGRLPSPQAAGRRRRARADGYSLVEVLLAIGLLGILLVSIAGLYFAGTKTVRSGRELTRAVVVAKSALEDVESWPYARVHAQAGAADTDSTASWSTDEPNPAFTGSADDIARMNAVADEWRTRVRQALPRGVLAYAVTGLVGFPTETSDGIGPFQDARLVRVSITVDWVEPGGRVRNVQFDRLVQ